MNTIYLLTKRNLKCFVKDRMSFFFSFMSPIVLLFLYLFFLADLQIVNIESVLKDIPDFVFSLNDAKAFVYAWLFANVISVAIISVSLGAAGNIVMDKENGIINDFTASPIANYKIIISYFLSILLISFLANIIIFVLGQVIIFSIVGEWIGFTKSLEFLMILIISLFSSVFFLMFVTSFLKTSSSYSAVASLFGTFIGFAIGAYMPINLFADWLQFLSNLLPASHTSALLRNLMMVSPLEQLLSQVPATAYDAIYLNMMDNFSLNLYLSDLKLSQVFMYSSIIISTLLFFGLNILRYRKKA